MLRSLCERLSLTPNVRNFFAYLIDQRRLVDFDAIRAEFEQLADAAAGLVKARVTAAAPLDDAQRERLQRALAARTGRSVELEVRSIPALIGGAVARSATRVRRQPPHAARPAARHLTRGE